MELNLPTSVVPGWVWRLLVLVEYELERDEDDKTWIDLGGES